jgi:hypothetical protein
VSDTESPGSSSAAVCMSARTHSALVTEDRSAAGVRDRTEPGPLWRSGGPRWVRMASGTAGRGWARAVTTGKSKPQLGAPSQPEARLMTFRAGGFEPLTQPRPWAALARR